MSKLDPPWGPCQNGRQIPSNSVKLPSNSVKFRPGPLSNSVKMSNHDVSAAPCQIRQITPTGLEEFSIITVRTVLVCARLLSRAPASSIRARPPPARASRAPSPAGRRAPCQIPSNCPSNSAGRQGPPLSNSVKFRQIWRPSPKRALHIPCAPGPPVKSVKSVKFCQNSPTPRAPTDPPCM